MPVTATAVLLLASSTLVRAAPPEAPPPAPATVAPAAGGDDVVDPTVLGDLGNAFFVKLWATLEPDSNLAVSPVSVWTALQLVRAGATGSTATAIDEATGVRDDVTADALTGLRRSWNGTSKPTTLRTADGLFVDAGFPLSPTFVGTLSARFDAVPEPLDFRREPEAAVARINDWVSERTRGLIPEVLDHVDPREEVMLVDTAYFLGTWAAPFEPDLTAPAPFRVNATRQVEVPTMHLERELRTAKVAGGRVVQLGFVGREFAAWVVLPDSDDGLAALEATLSAAQLSEIASSLRSREVDLALPKFDLAPPAVDLRDPMRKLGLGGLSGPSLCDVASSGACLGVSRSVHQARIGIDERVAEAGAATAMGAEAVSYRAPLQVVVDHPFLFLVRDRRSGMVVFAGRVVDPS